VAKSLVVVWGVLAIAMAILFMQIELAQIVWAKVMAVSTCGILGLMALAFLPRKVNPWAGVLGVVASYVCLAVLKVFLQVSPNLALVSSIPKDAAGVNFLLWPVICNLVCFGVGFAVDRIWPRREAA
jgi:hypothetical protein